MTKYAVTRAGAQQFHLLSSGLKKNAYAMQNSAISFRAHMRVLDKYDEEFTKEALQMSQKAVQMTMQVSDSVMELSTRLDSLGNKIEQLVSLGIAGLTKQMQQCTQANVQAAPMVPLERISTVLPLQQDTQFQVIDDPLREEAATVVNQMTGETFAVFPNPMRRVSHMYGKQGQNDRGMYQDCGIASTAKGINDLYGKIVINENTLVDYAVHADLCTLRKKTDGTTDWAESGGTWEADLKEMYEANGCTADIFDDASIPSMEKIAQRIMHGEVVNLAVNAEMLWHYEEAKDFDRYTMTDLSRYASDSQYRNHIDTLCSLQDDVNFDANHYVNVSNAIYDTSGNLHGFIVSDTGTGKTSVISLEEMNRAAIGMDGQTIMHRGCVIARRK